MQQPLPRHRLYHIGTQDGKLTLAHPTVIDLMPRLDVVIAHCTAVVAHHVHGLSHKVGRDGIDEIIIVSRWLTLQAVAAIGHNESVTILAPLFLHVGIDGRQPTAHLTFAQIVVLEKRPVDIAGVYPFQMYFLRFCRKR